MDTSIGHPLLPSVGELIVATIKRIESFGAYVELDEYNGKEGLLHISEISSTWVRNIRNHVREGQKVVLQVLRVNPSHGQIDLSLRRVSKDERRKKMEEWKKSRKAETLVRSIIGPHKIGDDELQETISMIVGKFGSLYAGLEEAAKRDSMVLEEAGVPNGIAQALTNVSKEKIAIKGVTIHGVFEMTALEIRGVEAIKATLVEAKTLGEAEDVEVNLYTLGAPKYRIDVTAGDYKKAEAALDKIVETTTSSWKGHDGKISFHRE